MRSRDWWLVTCGGKITRAWIVLLVGAACIFRPCSNRLNAQEPEIRIAAASDLRFVMPELARQAQKERHIRINVIYDSSGNSFAQIQNGAPFDLFFSADIEYPKKLEAAGFAVSGSLLEYAEGRIVLWTPADAKIDVTKQGWNALLDPDVHKIAIANPEHAPYGRAAVAALQNAGIYDRVKSKLVYGENISQAAQFVQSGNAQAGIIARSLAMSPGMRDGQMLEIPSDSYPPIQQAAVVLKGAANKHGALEFLDFIKSASARQILEKYGFVVPSIGSARRSVTVN